MAADYSQQLIQLLTRIEEWLPPNMTEADWQAHAYRWRRKDTLFGKFGYLQAVTHTAKIAFADLQHIERQKKLIYDNTAHFVAGKPANNVLLTGARGTGKSSLIKACLNEFANQGLRLVEVDKEHLTDLGDITEQLAKRSERFIIFCDDLSFEDGESGYKSLKSALDG